VIPFPVAPLCSVRWCALLSKLVYFVYILSHFHSTYLPKRNLKLAGTLVIAIRCAVPKTGSAVNHYTAATLPQQHSFPLLDAVSLPTFHVTCPLFTCFRHLWTSFPELLQVSAEAQKRLLAFEEHVFTGRKHCRAADCGLHRALCRLCSMSVAYY